MHHDVAIARGCRAIPYFTDDDGDGRSMEKIAIRDLCESFLSGENGAPGSYPGVTLSFSQRK